MKASALNCFAQLLTYPQEKDMDDVVNTIITELEGVNPQVIEDLRQFSLAVKDKKLEVLQELYTRTFDLKSLTSLDIGFVLFGEDYKRGAFLVEVQRLQKENKIDTGSELPDNISNVLKLLAVLEDKEEKNEFIEKIFLPALERIQADFDRSEGEKNEFLFPIRALKNYLNYQYEMNNAVLKGAIC